MKAFCITIKGHKDSEELSLNCLKTAAEVGGLDDVTIFDASTPKDKPFEVLESMNLSISNKMRINPDKRSIDAQCACFLSHYRLWQKTVELDENVLVLEHDSIFVAPMPDITFDYLVNLGKPSYGMKRYRKANGSGLQPFSHAHLNGTHGYAITPAGAQRCLKDIKQKGVWAAVDVALSARWIQEYHPWPIEANSYFSTIQYNNYISAEEK